MDDMDDIMSIPSTPVLPQPSSPEIEVDTSSEEEDDDGEIDLFPESVQFMASRRKRSLLVPPIYRLPNGDFDLPNFLRDYNTSQGLIDKRRARRSKRKQQNAESSRTQEPKDRTQESEKQREEDEVTKKTAEPLEKRQQTKKKKTISEETENQGAETVENPGTAEIQSTSGEPGEEDEEIPPYLKPFPPPSQAYLDYLESKESEWTTEDDAAEDNPTLDELMTMVAATALCIIPMNAANDTMFKQYGLEKEIYECLDKMSDKSRQKKRSAPKTFSETFSFICGEETVDMEVEIIVDRKEGDAGGGQITEERATTGNTMEKADEAEGAGNVDAEQQKTAEEEKDDNLPSQPMEEQSKNQEKEVMEAQQAADGDAVEKEGENRERTEEGEENVENDDDTLEDSEKCHYRLDDLKAVLTGNDRYKAARQAALDRLSFLSSDIVTLCYDKYLEYQKSLPEKRTLTTQEIWDEFEDLYWNVHPRYPLLWVPPNSPASGSVTPMQYTNAMVHEMRQPSGATLHHRLLLLLASRGKKFVTSDMYPYGAPFEIPPMYRAPHLANNPSARAAPSVRPTAIPTSATMVLRSRIRNPMDRSRAVTPGITHIYRMPWPYGTVGGPSVQYRPDFNTALAMQHGYGASGPMLRQRAADTTVLYSTTGMRMSHTIAEPLDYPQQRAPNPEPPIRHSAVTRERSVLVDSPPRLMDLSHAITAVVQQRSHPRPIDPVEEAASRPNQLDAASRPTTTVTEKSASMQVDPVTETEVGASQAIVTSQDPIAAERGGLAKMVNLAPAPSTAAGHRRGRKRRADRVEEPQSSATVMEKSAPNHTVPVTQSSSKSSQAKSMDSAASVAKQKQAPIDPAPLASLVKKSTLAERLAEPTRINFWKTKPSVVSAGITTWLNENDKKPPPPTMNLWKNVPTPTLPKWTTPPSSKRIAPPPRKRRKTSAKIAPDMTEREHSPQPGPSGIKSSSDPGPSGIKASPQPGPSVIESSSKPGPSGIKASPQPGPAGIVPSPQPGPSGVVVQKKTKRAAAKKDSSTAKPLRRSARKKVTFVEEETSKKDVAPEYEVVNVTE
uniref:ELM2 domain-containing protein n=1 Tax=Steinernema glaseri TaxID=37863 RepID=A0A1I7ZIV9_9BILA